MTSREQPMDLPPERPSIRAYIKMRASMWVLLGYIIFVIFLIGEVIMHAAGK